MVRWHRKGAIKLYKNKDYCFFCCWHFEKNGIFLATVEKNLYFRHDFFKTAYINH